MVFFSASLFQLSTGASIVWTSPILLEFKNENSTENPLGRAITSYEEGLIASIHSVGGTIGPILLTRMADIVGRKWFIISIAIAEVCAFIILSIAMHIYMYYLARLLLGICIGCSVIVLPIFIAEISDSGNRGKLVTVNNVFVCLGNVYGYSLDLLFPVKWFTLFCSVPAVICVLLFVTTLPESPIYLVIKNRTPLATQALMKFRNYSVQEAEQVVSQTKKMIHEMPKAKNMLFLLKNRGFRKSLMISNVIFILVQFTGIFAILEYLQTIFALTDIPFPEKMLGVVLSIVQTLSVLLGSALIEKLGRKRLQLLSGSVAVISLFTIGLYFKIKTFYNQDYWWLIVVGVLTFIVSYGAGMGPVCFVIMTEIFPPYVKMRAASITQITTSLSGFAVLFGFPLVRDSLGIEWCFWIFAITTSVNMIFTHFYVIETKNKSFLEIQSLLEKKINYRNPNY